MSLAQAVFGESAGVRGRVAAAGFFLTACLAFGAIALADEPASAISCSLDLVSERLAPGGSVTLIGWAYDASRAAPVRRMEVWLDDSVRGDVLLSGHRPDVAEHFGDGRYLSSGFTAMVSLGGVPPGPHRVSVTATSRRFRSPSAISAPRVVRSSALFLLTRP